MTMKIERVKVHNHDELRSIGCGHRIIDVKKGGKWLYYRGNSMHTWNRILRKRFDRLNIQDKIGVK